MGNRPPYLDAVTFKWEGAYREHDPVEPAAYGYKLSNFMRDVPDIWRKLDKLGMHPQVVTLMNRVVTGDNAAGEKLFEGLGQRTTKLSAGRHRDEPVDQKPDTLNYLESVKQIIRPLTEEKYKHEFGFGGIKDDYIRHEAMDMTYIRPHSGVWCLVYAAKKAGILSDKQATDWGLKYLSPHDANIPALVSGLPETASGRHALPDNLEASRGKGAEYLKASKIKMLSDLINMAADDAAHGHPEKLRLMQQFMHEGRIKFFEQTVAVEGERAGWGDPEGKSFYAAHNNTSTRQGWINRANDSFNYYYPKGMARAVEQARSQGASPNAAPANEYSGWDIATCVVTLGYNCKPTAKPTRPR